ncbi:MAG: DUF411 domain-containing protein [bacterium]
MKKIRTVSGPMKSGFLAGMMLSVAFVGNVAATEAIVKVYKNPSCGCCTKWTEHLEREGFKTEVNAVGNMQRVKRETGVPKGLKSCHTAKVADYFVEGHVPAADIRRLLEERPDIAGLAVPAMPIGSPGMEVPGRKPMPYKVFAVGHDGSTSVFSQH